MWTVITKEQIKDYPVGTKVRLNGLKKTYIASHGKDYSFTVGSDDTCPDNLYEESYWDNYEVAVWVPAEKVYVGRGRWMVKSHS